MVILNGNEHSDTGIFDNYIGKIIQLSFMFLKQESHFTYIMQIIHAWDTIQLP